MITKERVLEALRNVEDPDLKKDIVTLGMVEDIAIEGKVVSFKVVLTTPACPLKSVIENACRNAVIHLVDTEADVRIVMSSRVTAQPQRLQHHIKNVILVSSGKGGVGKSTVSANLSLAMASLGAKVGLIDADIYGPSIPTMFGLENAKPQSVEIEGKNKIKPIEKYGIKLLSLGFFAEPGQPVPWRGPMASTAIKQLLNDAEWGELDYLVVDLPPGTGDIHITVSNDFGASGAVIVSTPQIVALADTRKGVNMFKMEGINIPILGIIENMSYFSPPELPDKKYYIFGQGGGKKLSEEFGAPFLGELPIVERIAESGDRGLPIVLQDENSEEAQRFVELAKLVAQQVTIANTQK